MDHHHFFKVKLFRLIFFVAVLVYGSFYLKEKKYFFSVGPEFFFSPWNKLLFAQIILLGGQLEDSRRFPQEYPKDMLQEGSVFP